MGRLRIVVWGLGLSLAGGIVGKPFVLCSVVIVLVLLPRRRASPGDKALLAALCCILFAHGCASIGAHESHVADMGQAALRASPVWIEGWVASYPQPSFGGRRFEFSTNMDGTPHRLLVRAGEFEIDYGDSLRLLAVFQRRGRKSDARYFLGRGVCGAVRARTGTVERLPGRNGSWWVRECFWPLHHRLRCVTERGLGARAGVPLALLLGERGAIGRSAHDGFVQLGISHLLALSGFHLGFIAGVLILITRLARVRAGWWIVASLIVYVAVVGPILSLYRALVMAVLVAIASGVHRPRKLIALLGNAFLLILLVLPFAFFSVGFQLSFLATLGVLVVIQHLPSPPAGHWLRRTAYGAWATVVVSVAVQILLTPLLLAYFGKISLVAPLATVVFAAPVMVLLALTAASAVVALAFPPAAETLYEVTNLASGLFDWLLHGCMSLAPPPLEAPAPNPYLFYMGIVLVWLRPRNRWARLGGAIIVSAAWVPWINL